MMSTSRPNISIVLGFEAKRCKAKKDEYGI